MAHDGHIPKGKLARSLVGGKTAARIGGAMLEYAVKKPFRGKDEQAEARREMSAKSARALFGGLCQLRGTALKIAQLLSLELDLFPPEVRRELERSYNEAPPMNRAMARKALANAYGRPPEEVFASFEAKAFAAASLGQVHRATAHDGSPLALKIQYPGIARTIRNDVLMLKGLLRPLGEYSQIKPAIDEIEKRFLEETDYVREASNVNHFREHLDMDGVLIPEARPDKCTDKVLCLSYMEGLPLNAWLKTGPDQEARDAVAQRLQDVFIRSLYGLGVIHADPNPGNFVIGPDMSVGMVDFGCVKKFDSKFVELYRRMVLSFKQDDSEACLDILRKFGTIPPEAPSSVEDDIRKVFTAYGAWLKEIFTVEVFDFNEHDDFIKRGKAISTGMKKTWKQLNINPEFVFLDRTRYGLFRLFERMGARVGFRNAHEWR